MFLRSVMSITLIVLYGFMLSLMDCREQDPVAIRIIKIIMATIIWLAASWFILFT